MTFLIILYLCASVVRRNLVVRIVSTMSIDEKLYFMRQVREAFGSIGAIIPTSRYAARAMASEFARRRGPRAVLEAGAGTGAITAEIIRQLGPDDRLVMCEINPHFAAYLRRRFEREPAFRRVREQVTLYETSVTEIQGRHAFDCIISAIPFTSCPPEVTEAILEHYRTLLKPGGTLSYIEYAWLRGLKRRLAAGKTRAQAVAVNAVLDRSIRSYQFRRDLVWRNVPPAWIRHLRFGEPQPSDALQLRPLEHSHRVAVGKLAVADDVLPPVAGLAGLALLLARRESPIARLWPLPLGLATALAWFLRDPYRHVIPDPDAVYAACDGRVLAVERLHDSRFGTTEWLRIAVFLSLANVHINRAPVAGRVVQIVREQGGYAAANHYCAEHNAAQYTLIEGVHGPCVVAQRAGMVARRIVNRVGVGDLLAQGERLGLIRLGSRTDVYLPADRVWACVTPGAVVRAGMTVLARYVDMPRLPARS